MKANELMIGDWVFNKNINKPMQVYPMMFSQMFRQRPDATTEDYNIFPIPLTADILEANGWERNPLLKYTDELRILDDYYELNIHEFNDGTWNVQYDCIEMGGIPMCSMNICYVHELQHFLRAVGIDTEIIVKEDGV